MNTHNINIGIGIIDIDIVTHLSLYIDHLLMPGLTRYVCMVYVYVYGSM